MTTLATLPGFFRPHQSNFLIRLGRDFDGGYLIDSRDIDKTKALVSFGVNEDWSFEKQFSKKKRIPVFAYDATLNVRYLLRRAWRSLIRLNPLVMACSFHALFNYRIFFSGNRHHFQRYVGLDGVTGFITLSSVLDEVKQKSGVDSHVFMKVDIEGWEYRILDELIEHSHRFTGLAIELHDVDIHLDKLQDFIEHFPLKLVHVHANNYSPITRGGIPLAIECTFSSSESSAMPVSASLPHPLDMPNKRNRDEVALSFR